MENIALVKAGHKKMTAPTKAEQERRESPDPDTIAGIRQVHQLMKNRNCTRLNWRAEIHLPTLYGYLDPRRHGVALWQIKLIRALACGVEVSVHSGEVFDAKVLH